EPRAHRVAHQVDALEPQVVHQAQDVAHQFLAAIGGRIVRLVALAVAARIVRDDAVALALEGPVPAEPAPVLGAAGGEAVHHQHGAGRAGLGRDVVIGEGEPAGVERGHAVTLGGLRRLRQARLDLTAACHRRAGAHAQLWPVEPKPPWPRAVSSNASTSRQAACTTGAITSWAMRSPRRTTKFSGPWLTRITITSPR